MNHHIVIEREQKKRVYKNCDFILLFVIYITSVAILDNRQSNN